MAIHTSVLKRERQNATRRMRNRIIKSKVHTAFRRVNEAIHTKDQEAANAGLKVYNSQVDKAVKRGVYHKNKGARLKSRLNKSVKVHFVAAK